MNVLRPFMKFKITKSKFVSSSLFLFFRFLVFLHVPSEMANWKRSDQMGEGGETLAGFCTVFQSALTIIKYYIYLIVKKYFSEYTIKFNGMVYLLINT